MSLFGMNEMAVFIGGTSTNPQLAMRIGEEVEIIDPLGTHRDYQGLPQYGVKFSCGREAWVLETSLSKKKPPKEELGSWKEVQKITEGWNPAKEEINV